MPSCRVPEASQEEVETYAKKACFLVDASLGVNVAEVLREHGWNAKYVA